MVTIYLYEHRSRCLKNTEIFIYSIRHIKLGNEKLLILMFMYSLNTMSCIIFLEGIEKSGNIRGFFFNREPAYYKITFIGKKSYRSSAVQHDVRHYSTSFKLC